jgi:hypothetical protein
MDIPLARIEVINVLDLIIFKDKAYYDRKYTSIFLKIGE